MNIKIRELVSEDVVDAAKIHVQTFHDTYQGMIPSEKLNEMTDESMIPRWKDIIEGNKANLILLGAFLDEKLIGTCASGTPRGEFGFDSELWSMNIPKINQRKGAGKLLFQKSIERLTHEGKKSMYLCCIDKNINALDFYRAMGGEITDMSVQRDGYQEIIVKWNKLPH
ncbi:MAG: GNAT family N-acetyltransferase [Oligoflexus sp.]|nr:GNAT family N-acetyltransferase [Oligoflexus sp.]